MKKIIPILLIAVCLCCLSACFPYTYRGEHKELYTVAIYSIPDSIGAMPTGEIVCNPVIYILEQDDYGRTIFAYCEDDMYCRFALVVSQGYDETNVYFYPDVNYVFTVRDLELAYMDDSLKNAFMQSYLENRDKLKEANDWNKPIDKTKCVSHQITDDKKWIEEDDVYNLSKDECNEILNYYSETIDIPYPSPRKKLHWGNGVLQVDAEGRLLHIIRGLNDCTYHPDWDKSKEHCSYYITLFVITDKYGNYDKENGIMAISSYSTDGQVDVEYPYDPADVAEFKARNGWKYPFCA